MAYKNKKNQKLWVERNKERLKEYKENYRKTHRKRIREYDKKWRELNRLDLRKIRNKYKREHTSYWNKYEVIRKNRLRSNGGSFTIKEWEELKRKYNYNCAFCGESGLTVDHIIPISGWKKWIKNHPEIKYKCGDIGNIQPLCLSCNSKKHNRIMKQTKKISAML
jgi:5-methylcytosine-specific restriction endonuclease McrA